MSVQSNENPSGEEQPQQEEIGGTKEAIKLMKKVNKLLEENLALEKKIQAVHQENLVLTNKIENFKKKNAKLAEKNVILATKNVTLAQENSALKKQLPQHYSTPTQSESYSDEELSPLTHTEQHRDFDNSVQTQPPSNHNVDTPPPLPEEYLKHYKQDDEANDLPVENTGKTHLTQDETEDVANANFRRRSIKKSPLWGSLGIIIGLAITTLFGKVALNSGDSQTDNLDEAQTNTKVISSSAATLIPSINTDFIYRTKETPSVEKQSTSTDTPTNGTPLVGKAPRDINDDDANYKNIGITGIDAPTQNSAVVPPKYFPMTSIAGKLPSFFPTKQGDTPSAEPEPIQPSTDTLAAAVNTAVEPAQPKELDRNYQIRAAKASTPSSDTEEIAFEEHPLEKGENSWTVAVKFLADPTISTGYNSVPALHNAILDLNPEVKKDPRNVQPGTIIKVPLDTGSSPSPSTVAVQQENTGTREDDTPVIDDKTDMNFQNGIPQVTFTEGNTYVNDFTSTAQKSIVNNVINEGVAIDLTNIANQEASPVAETSNELPPESPPCTSLPVTTEDAEGNLYTYNPCHESGPLDQPSQSFNSTADKEFGLTEEGKKLKGIIGSFTPGDVPVPAHTLPNPL